ncbi:MAG: CpcT/CpeT family chromophore lyase [Phycisphaerales bacterium]|jgi:hypothetical protein|nr:CpcT/CpeT family chromophore lyase [Phycisphaerales bacterium]
MKLATLSLVALSMLTPAAIAGAPAPLPAANEAYADLDAIGQMIVGTWRTASSVEQADGAGSTQVVLSIAPVKIEGMENTFYVEGARADALYAPYRQAIFQLYTYKGGARLRTLEFHNTPKGFAEALVGLAAAPEFMPAINPDNLIATLDIELKPAGGGWSGATPYAYPTRLGGAVEMTSSFSVTKDTLTSADRGFAADGSIAWGASEGSSYTFKRTTEGPKVTKIDDGVTIIEFAHPEGETLADGDRVAFHYSGYLAASGEMFDSSREPGRAVLSYVAPGSLIQGFRDGAAGSTPGTIRRVLIPSALGYGDRGAGARIPANSDLIFDIECMYVQKVASDEASDAGQ